MRRVVLFVATCALCLGLAGTASAGPPRNHGRPYHHTHGVRFSGGYYYKGQHHRHWKHRVYNARHKRWHYYDPYVRSYYYWAPAYGCYYPVTYVR